MLQFSHIKVHWVHVSWSYWISTKIEYIFFSG